MRDKTHYTERYLILLKMEQSKYLWTTLNKLYIKKKNRRLRWAKHVAHMWNTSAYRILVVTPEQKRPLGRSRCGKEENMKMYLQEVWWVGLDWISLAQGYDRWQALVNVVMNFQVPQNRGNFLTSWGPVSFSGRTLPHGASLRFSHTYHQ